MKEQVAYIISILAALFRSVYVIRIYQKRIYDLEHSSMVNRLMYKAVHTANIDRFCIFKISNGVNYLFKDGTLRNYTVSCIDEVHKKYKEPNIDLYQKLLVDTSYKLMVKKAYESDYYEFVTDIESPCDLKDIYLNEGVKYSRIYHLHLAGGVEYYCSLANFTGENYREVEEEIIKEVIQKIRQYYKKVY
jgi:hypothetical protein